MRYKPTVQPYKRRYLKNMSEFVFWTVFGCFEVPQFFVYDGASKPRIASFLLNLGSHDPRELGPSLAHDYLYRTKLVDRKRADLIYKHMLEVNGVHWVPATIQYVALRWFGWIGWMQSPGRLILDLTE